MDETAPTKQEDERAEPLDLSNRLTLRIREVAQVLGISERAVRAMLPDLPHFRAGTIPLVPVEGLRRYVEERAQDRTRRTARTVRELSTRRDH